MAEHLMREQVEDFESAVTKLSNVRAVRAVVGGGGRVVEVHVIASTEKDGRTVVRDIETIAQVEFDVDLDRRVVSVACFDERSTNRETSLLTVIEHVDMLLQRVQGQQVVEALLTIETARALLRVALSSGGRAA